MAPTPAPWSFILIRLLFRFVLKIFYGTIVVENADLIPKTGKACIVCANHSNSLTDALLLVTAIPPKQRNMLRLTAKATQFGRKTFTSWLIESAGTIPIHRRKEAADGSVDNTEAMKTLMKALEAGDACCLFPEGFSRYHPSLSPLKTGVARLVSDVLTANRDNEDFEVYVQTCSVTYMHRQHFRSDVLVTFHEPTRFTPKANPELLAPVDFQNIREVTNTFHQQIASGTIDAPSWDNVRASRTAAKIYAPIGTKMTLGDFVRVTKVFSEAFKADSNTEELFKELQEYQSDVSRLGITDQRVRKPLSRRVILGKLLRLLWIFVLFSVSLPGLVLWAPVFGTTFYATHNFKKTGPIFDTWDEIAQIKLVYGLLAGVGVWAFAVIATFPFAFLTFWAVPLVMWLSLRWTEDGISSARAFAILVRLLFMNKSTLMALHERRKALHERVMALAQSVHLPPDPESYFAESGGREKGRVRGTIDSGAKYFSLTRRRKKDWLETLRLYDKVDFPEDDSINN